MAFVDNGKDAAGRQNIDFTFARGDTKTIQFTLDDGASTPSPLDLTGASAVLSVHSVEEPSDLTTQLFTITGVISAPATGVVTFKPTDANALQSPNEYYYDAELTLSDGTVCSFAAGLWTVVADRANAGV